MLNKIPRTSGTSNYHLACMVKVIGIEMYEGDTYEG